MCDNNKNKNKTMIVDKNPMEVFYQRRCAKYIYVVPEGLRELMTDISREVLRHHPEHIYTFIADYLDALLITRENARVAARLVEDITETSVIISDLLRRTGMTREQADKSARIIQRAFRRHIKRRSTRDEHLDEDTILEKLICRTNITCEKAQEAARIIQRAFRFHKIRRTLMYDTNYIDWRIAARNTLGIYRKLNVSHCEMKRAATLIQAAYRGYYTRRFLKHLLIATHIQIEEEEEEEVRLFAEEEEGEFDYDDREKVYLDHLIEERAAVTIQRAFRKYQRKMQENITYLVGEGFESLDEIQKGGFGTVFGNEKEELKEVELKKSEKTESDTEPPSVAESASYEYEDENNQSQYFAIEEEEEEKEE